jgi:hypothetical protein
MEVSPHGIYENRIAFGSRILVVAFLEEVRKIGRHVPDLVL